MAPNPCCFTLQTGTRVVGIVQIIGGIAGTLLWIYSILMIRQHAQRYWLQFNLLDLIAIGIVLLGMVLAIILGILILIAASQRNIRKCRAWLNIMVGFTVLYVLNVGFNAWVTGFGVVALEETIYVFVNFYMMWVVCAFMQEIESCPKLLSKTDDEEE